MAAIGDRTSTDLSAFKARRVPAKTGAKRSDLLASVAGVVARSQRAETTQITYKRVYDGFERFMVRELGRPPVITDVNAAAFIAYRDHLKTTGGRSGRGAAPRTLEKTISALRVLARAVGAPADTQSVKTPRVPRKDPPALTYEEYLTLLSIPDRRSRLGKRDYAILLTLGECGLRNAELRAANAADVRPSRVGSSKLELVVPQGKGNKYRRVGITSELAGAIDAWIKVRPGPCHELLDNGDDPLFLTLGRAVSGNDEGRRLSAATVGKLVGKYTTTARLPDGKRHPHILRHTFCTNAAEDGTPIEVIAQEAGHASIRTTQAYIAVTDQRRREAVERRDRRRSRSAIPTRKLR